MSNEVKIILSAVDNASKVLDKSGTSLESTLKAASVVGVAAFGAISAAVIDSVNTTVEYAEQVRDLSRALGTNSEESSKLIQIADDLNIEYGTLKQGFKKALTEGVAPNIDGIKGLAKEYQALQTPVEKSQFAIKYFGRAGLELNKILELSPEKIDAMAQSAIDAGLVLSGEAVQSARDYEIALDDLGDTVQGVKIAVGNALIPVLIDLAEVTSDGITAYKNLAEAESTVKTAMDLGIITAGEKRDIMRQLQLGTADLNEVTLLADQITRLNTENNYEAIIAKEKMKGITEDVTEATDAQAEAEAALKQELENLKSYIAGPVGDEYEKFKTKNEELTAKGEELRAKIEELEGMEYLTADQKAELDQSVIELGEVSTEMTANADAHDEATSRILFNLLQQQLAIGGWTDDELTLLTEVGNRWGLIDDKTLEATTGMQTALGEFADSGDVDKALDALDQIKDKADGIPNDINIRVEVNVANAIAALDRLHGKTGKGRQFGGPVEAGQSYMVGEAGPEMFVPSQSGTIVNNFNLTANYRNRDRASLALDIKMLAALYG